MTDTTPHPSGISLKQATLDDAEAVHALIVALAEAQDAAHMVTSMPDDLRRDGLHEGAKLQALLEVHSHVTVVMIPAPFPGLLTKWSPCW